MCDRNNSGSLHRCFRRPSAPAVPVVVVVCCGGGGGQGYLEGRGDGLKEETDGGMVELRRSAFVYFFVFLCVRVSVYSGFICLSLGFRVWDIYQTSGQRAGGSSGLDQIYSVVFHL